MPYDTNEAADMLRRLALDENLKNYILADSKLRLVAKRVAQKYVAGETISEAIARASLVSQQGYTSTIDFMGESTRSESEAGAALNEFLRLVKLIGAMPSGTDYLKLPKKTLRLLRKL